MHTLQTLLLAVGLYYVSAHITLNPSFGAKGGEYFYTEVSIPHSKPGFWTSGIEIQIPHGILSVKPQAKAGWDVLTSRRTLEPSEQYTNHGQIIDTAVDKVTYKAKTSESAIHHDVLELFGMQVQLGCKYNDAKSATIWNSQRTLWFGVVQHLSVENSIELTEQTNWTGIASGAESWNNAEPEPSPYLFVSNWSSCVSSTSNFTWFDEVVPVPRLTSADIVVTEQQLLTTIEVELDELSDKLKENTNVQIRDALRALPPPPPPVDAVTRDIAIAALVLALIAVVLAVVLIVLQIKGSGVKSA